MVVMVMMMVLEIDRGPGLMSEAGSFPVQGQRILEGLGSDVCFQR